MTLHFDNIRFGLALAGLGMFMTTGTLLSAEANMTVEGGTITFLSKTNISAVSVKGKSSAMQARAHIQRGPEGLRVEAIEAWVPVKTLATGMAVRDEHMRKYIFTTPDGKTPDVRFEGKESTCGGAGGKGDQTCSVAGTLSIRGVTRPFTLPLKVREDRGSFRAAADSVVKLSDYGIERPSEFGVKPIDEVQLHFEFTGKEASVAAASLGGSR